MARFDWRAEWARRSWWMNLMFAFCLYMTFAYLPFDLFWKSVERDDEVWLGFLVHGWVAKATEPLHWLIYASGAYGFWKMRSWMWPWAAVYVAQIAVGMIVWNVRDPRGAGWLGGAVAAVPFVIGATALWRSRSRFETSPSAQGGAR